MSEPQTWILVCQHGHLCSIVFYDEDSASQHAAYMSANGIGGCLWMVLAECDSEALH